jgi:hypothetical protein
MVSWPVYEPLDALRRIAGAWLDANAPGRREAPYRIVHAEPGVALRAYEAPRRGPVAMLVPAPIEQAYSWDRRRRAPLDQGAGERPGYSFSSHVCPTSRCPKLWWGFSATRR